ncbi:MAG TPA: rhamnulokinase family protein, partial [Candidatus Saccharimonadales bacterium]|nr:rhamnulokinase family protein [Candidatus Saccharimonadales bacterium]
MNEQVYLGIDLGAESGRVMAGAWNGRQLRVEELHRFSNGPVNIAGSLRWDVLRLWSEIQHGLSIAAKHFGDEVVSVGVDTWGVDFVLLTKSGEMLGQPYHYRDARVNGMFDYAFKRVPRAEIFAQTGLQFMELNTLYQLLAFQRTSPDLLAATDCLLMMPDFFHWCLCGSRVAEFTDATTSQCLNPTTRDWAFDLLGKFDLPAGIFPKIVPPGTEIGRLRESVSARTGLGPIKVITPPTHDTASAVAAIPTGNTGKTTWAYISSGTWSLMGVETQNALLSDRVLQLNLTNEGGIDGTFRLLKNITGLWLVQQCKRAFEARGRNLDYAELARLAEESPSTGVIIDPD